MYRILLRGSPKKLPRNDVLVWHQNKCEISSSPQGIVSQAGFGKYLIILAPFVTVGGVAAYAKQDDEFRKTLVKNVPAAEKPLRILLGEDKPLAGITNTFDGMKKSVTGLFDSGSSKVEDKAQQIKNSIPPITSSVRSKSTATQSDTSIPVPAPTPPPSSSASKATSVPATPYVAKAKKEEAPKAKAATPTTTVPAKAAAPAVAIGTLSSSELERSVEVAATIAVQEYHKAVNVLKSYNEDVKKIVDDSIEKLDNSLWSNLKNKTTVRDSAVTIAEKAAEEARSRIQQIERELYKNKILSPEELESIKKTIKTVSDHLDTSKVELSRAKDLADAGEKYWKKVETARNYFVDEMEAIFPGINLSERKLNLSKDDLDLFILHAYSHVLAYQKELQKLEIDGQSKLKRAIETVKNAGDDSTETVRAQLDYHLEKLKRDLAIENQKKIFKIKAESEKELRLQMKRQAAAHSDHLKESVELKESELKRLYGRELDEKLSSEQAAYKLQLATMLGKLKGMNDALKARANSDKSAQQAQALWSACISLWNSVKYGDPTVSWDKRIKPLENEIKAINTAAADGDRLVATVLKSIPVEVQKRGVYPENALRERFVKVEKMARRLALVPENGAKLPLYILSYLQSVFIVSQSDPISKEELANQSIDFSKLDTYDILNRARYWLDHGNIIQAVKYMNLLNGASRKVAGDWINEARIYLETQQAVNALMAYAESSGYSTA